MTIQFISDIHGDEADLKEVLNLGIGKKTDLIVLCGDYLNHGPRNPLPKGWNPRGVADLLNPLASKIIAVRGNCDAEVDEMVLNFPCLSSNSSIFADGIRFFVHHGHLYDRERIFKMIPRGTIVVSGHTHIPLLEEENGILFLNPGSISLPKSSEEKTFAFAEISKNCAEIAICSISGKKICEKLWSL